MISRYSLPGMVEIWSDENRFQKMLQIEILACEALAKLGQIPNKDLVKIRASACINVARIEEIEKIVKHDVIAFLTQVGETVGNSSRYLHLGMTSSDVLDTALAVQMVEAAKIILQDLKALQQTLKKQARKYKDTLMIGRTHGVHAEPITFGFKLAGWYAEVGRAIERLSRAKEIIGVGKISGAVGTYAHIDPFVEKYVCEKMGLQPALHSTQIIQRDRHAEYLMQLALVAATTEKFALEIRHLQRTEVLELEEPFTSGQKGSSAMPHKRNPILSENICGLSRLIRTNALAALENVALWHERDISHSSVERVIIPDSTMLLDFIVQRLNYILENFQVYPQNMIENLKQSEQIIASQRILLELVRKGASREEAYQLVQSKALKARSEMNKEVFLKLLLKDKKILHYLSEKEINRCFDIRYFVRRVPQIFQRLGLK